MKQAKAKEQHHLRIPQGPKSSACWKTWTFGRFGQDQAPNWWTKKSMRTISFCLVQIRCGVAVPKSHQWFSDRQMTHPECWKIYLMRSRYKQTSGFIYVNIYNTRYLRTTKTPFEKVPCCFLSYEEGQHSIEVSRMYNDIQQHTTESWQLWEIDVLMESCEVGPKKTLICTVISYNFTYRDYYNSIYKFYIFRLGAHSCWWGVTYSWFPKKVFFNIQTNRFFVLAPFPWHQLGKK